MAAAVRPALLSAAQFHLRGHQLLAHHLEPVPYGAREAVLAPLHATLTVANGQPVSPALRCVVTLTVFFFSVYLAVVAVRLAKTVALRGSRKCSSESLNSPIVICEEALADANDTLVHVPMLCILFICARLRAMQINPSKGDPERWVQICMYISTSALLARFMLDFASSAWQLQHCVVGTARSLASITVYGVSGAIVAFVLLAGSAASPEQVPPIPPTLWCVAVLSATYFAEFLIVELASLAFGSNAVYRAHDEQVRGGVEAVLQQFPSMFCVLLVGMTLRMVQLGLKPPTWAIVGMYISTVAVMFQGTLAVVSMLLVAARQTRPLQDASGAGGRVAYTCQLMLLFCLCLGASMTLVSVFAMEKDPLAEFWPHTVDRQRRPDSGADLSTTMRCVMLLAFLYFSIKLCLVAVVFTCGPFIEWAANALLAVQSDLAFAPMLCVMMIGVRLRAMQLRLRDPQPWAQTAMYAASYSVLVHVSCSLLCPAPVSNAGGDGNFDAKELALVSKAGIIALLALRYIASVALFVSVGVLIAALVSMDPDMAVLF